MHQPPNFESSSDEESGICPICCNPMDATDLRFFPCPCKYQLCLWCFNEIKGKDNRCPNCRREYQENMFYVRNNYETESGEEGSEVKKHRGNRHGRDDSSWREGHSLHSTRDDTKKRMHSMRIIQRNLVYIVGMVREDAVEEELVSESMFGKYGKITKIVINMPASSTNTSSSTSAPVPSSSSTVSFYLTFEKEEEALSCIHSVNGFIYKGSLLRASFGTTKYCNSFINGVPCENKDCLYLHTEAPPEDCFLREEMTNGDSKFFQRTHPAYGSLPYSRSLMKRLSSRYGDVLPDKDEPLLFFGMDRLWEEQFTFEKIPREEPESVPTTVYFTADPDSVRTTYHKEIGEPINLNDLFDGASKTDDNHNPDHSNTDKEDSLSGDCKSPNQDTEDNLIDDIINYSSESNRW